MDSSVYFSRLESDPDSNFGSGNYSSNIQNMDHMDMDEQLIANQKQTFWVRNRRWLYLVVGIIAGCFVTVGISYLFFSLGKEKGQGNSQSNVNSINAAQQQNQLPPWAYNSSLAEGELGLSLGTMLTAEATKFKEEIKNLLEDYMKILLTKEDSAKLLTLLQGIKNESQQELDLIKESRDEIMELLADLKNKSLKGDDRPARDCVDWKQRGQTTDGVYSITPYGSRSFDVYCDMTTDGGGWLVFQRREDGSVDFYRDWDEYEQGFGDPSDEFWLGNKYIHILTSQGPTELRIDLTDWNNDTRYAKYSSLKLGDAVSKYTLYVDGYSGTAGDGLALHHKVKFSTKDQDNDIKRRNCAVTGKGAWWYENCSHASLNGEYIKNTNGYADKNKGVNWEKWKGDNYSLKKASMMMRRKL